MSGSTHNGSIVVLNLKPHEANSCAVSVKLHHMNLV